LADLAGYNVLSRTEAAEMSNSGRRQNRTQIGKFNLIAQTSQRPRAYAKSVREVWS